MRFGGSVLLLASLAAAAPSKAPQKARTLVDAALYDKFVYYGAYTQLANQCPCANPSVPGKLIRFIDNRLTDTQVSIWKVEEDKEFIVAIPGTTSTQDAITDISVLLLGYHSVNVFCPGLCAVHSGFLTAWNSVAGDVTKALTELLAKNPEYTVSLTGHSLGGAIVGLAFPSLRNGPYNVTQAFTFGQPQVGNQAYANYLDSISGATEEDAGVYYRVTHANDIVPTLPGKILPLFFFKHSRTEYWESSIEQDNAGKTYRCYGQEPTDCIKSNKKFGSEAHTTYAGFNSTCGNE